MYLSNDINSEILKFCNKTENLKNFPICEDRLYNNSGYINSFSTQNLKIYSNLTQEIIKKNNLNLNINNDNIDFKKVDLNLISLITQISLLFFYFLFYNSVRNQEIEVDIMNLSPADYTLMLSEFDLPNEIKDFNELKVYLETEVKIIFSYFLKLNLKLNLKIF